MLGEGVAADDHVGMIFMSYRREDSSGHAIALQAKLEHHFGAAAIVRDLEDIKPGIDFRRFISETLPKCSVLLALIGPRWSSAIDKDGRPRKTYLYHVADNETTMREYGSQAVVWQTAINPVIALELVASGTWSDVGVLGPEAFDPVPFMDLLNDHRSPWGMLELTPAG